MQTTNGSYIGKLKFSSSHKNSPNKKVKLILLLDLT
jgi:hypothetical protein